MCKALRALDRRYISLALYFYFTINYYIIVYHTVFQPIFLKGVIYTMEAVLIFVMTLKMMVSCAHVRLVINCYEGNCVKVCMQYNSSGF